MGSNIISKEEMEEIVKNSFTISECLRKMNRSTIGGNYRTFYRYKGLYNLDTSHFTGQKTNINGKNSKDSIKPVEYYLHKDCYESSIKSSKLLKKLIDAGYKQCKCEKCGITEWCNEPIVFQLHHIDGDHFNNEIDNLKVLCPNCHSQTENFCGKNKQNKKIYYCKECGKEITYYSKSNLCQTCLKKSKRIVKNRPDKNDLYNMLKEMNFSMVAKKYGVSDNAIRKWCRLYGIPDKAKFYK